MSWAVLYRTNGLIPFPPRLLGVSLPVNNLASVVIRMSRKNIQVVTTGEPQERSLDRFQGICQLGLQSVVPVD